MSSPALSILLGVIGPWQVVLIVVVVLLLFGGKKIPELMKGLGEGPLRCILVDERRRGVAQPG